MGSEMDSMEIMMMFGAKEGEKCLCLAPFYALYMILKLILLDYLLPLYMLFFWIFFARELSLN